MIDHSDGQVRDRCASRRFLADSFQLLQRYGLDHAPQFVNQQSNSLEAANPAAWASL